MRNRAFRPIAATLGILLLAGTPVHAAPIAIRDVIQVVGRYQNPPELRLRSLSQLAGKSISSASGLTGVDSRVNSSGDFTDVAPVDATSSDTLLSGIALPTSAQQAGVEITGPGDVDATVCDCGDITVAGGFPKWPLLFLAAVPFLFIHDCDHCDDSTPIPTPTPTPPPTPQIPEPTSLLLFGSGLAAFAAGLRRRYGKSKIPAPVGEEG